MQVTKQVTFKQVSQVVVPKRRDRVGEQTVTEREGVLWVVVSLKAEGHSQEHSGISRQKERERKATRGFEKKDMELLLDRSIQDTSEVN